MRRAAAALLAVALFAPGCIVDGPRFTRTAAIAPLPPASGVVVSDFYYQAQHLPARSELPDSEARPIEVTDVSESIAAALTAHGLESVARAHADPRDVGSGRLLLRGYVMNNGIWPPPMTIIPVMLFIGTGFIFGGLVPFFPIQPVQQCQIKFQINLTDSDGNVVLFQKDSLRAKFIHYYIWTLFKNYCLGGRMQAGVEEELARALSAAISTTR
jgi:hypothetical protein